MDRSARGAKTGVHTCQSRTDLRRGLVTPLKRKGVGGVDLASSVERVQVD